MKNKFQTTMADKMVASYVGIDNAEYLRPILLAIKKGKLGDAQALLRIAGFRDTGTKEETPRTPGEESSGLPL